MSRTTTKAFSARRVLFGALALALCSTSSFALGTSEQRAACTPDVFRLCSSEIPNVDKIVACLRTNRANLSDGCKTVFSSTRSLATPERELCTFNTRVPEPGQEHWMKWCGDAAR